MNTTPNYRTDDYRVVRSFDGDGNFLGLALSSPSLLGRHHGYLLGRTIAEAIFSLRSLNEFAASKRRPRIVATF